ncbi:MAG: hypothetical protein AAB355_02545 [Patescibacteria group bacterium]
MASAQFIITRMGRIRKGSLDILRALRSKISKTCTEAVSFESSHLRYDFSKYPEWVFWKSVVVGDGGFEGRSRAEISLSFLEFFSGDARKVYCLALAH